ncbi:MAG: hypothetical protein GY749_02235 [Desulfobacteraceae bacterium]|nr:hypothetical protein [Desulfobacteraceae bacterium]
MNEIVPYNYEGVNWQIEAVLQQAVSRFGIPQSISADNGRSYRTALKYFCCRKPAPCKPSQKERKSA